MKLREKYKVKPGAKLELADRDAADTAGIENKKQALPMLEDHRESLH